MHFDNKLKNCVMMLLSVLVCEMHLTPLFVPAALSKTFMMFWW